MYQLQLLVATVIAALMFLVVPLEGAVVPIVRRPGVSTELPPDSVEEYDFPNTTQNTTVSDEVEDVFTRFLSTVQQQDPQDSPSMVDSSTHSRVRRWTEMTAETIQSHSENLQTRSKCSWTYSYNTDPHRLPQTLVEAQCTQQYVRGLAGQCEHVYYYVPVKRNVSGTWTDQWIWLRVGCTLATPLGAPPITFD